MFKRILIGHFSIGKAYYLIQDTQSIPHTTFAFLCYQLKGLWFCLDLFLH